MKHRMRATKINHTYSYLLVAVSLLAILNFRGCRDLEDCRSIYTNEVWVGFNSKNELALDSITLHDPYKILIYNQHSIYADTKKKILSNLKDNKQLRFNLSPKHNRITLLFYQTPPTGMAAPEPDTVTIFYKRIASLLSPSCGIQEEYIIDKVETTFAESKIIKPALKKYESDQEESKKPNIEIYY